MALQGWIHQVCKLPPSSDTSLAESAGSPAGIVRVKLKNNKTCQCRFPSCGARHQWVLKKTAVALIFPFFTAGRNLADLLQHATFLLLCLCQDQRMAGLLPQPGAGGGMGTRAEQEWLYSTWNKLTGTCSAVRSQFKPQWSLLDPSFIGSELIW